MNTDYIVKIVSAVGEKTYSSQQIEKARGKGIHDDVETVLRLNVGSEQFVEAADAVESAFRKLSEEGAVLEVIEDGKTFTIPWQFVRTARLGLGAGKIVPYTTTRTGGGRKAAVKEVLD